MEVSVVFRQGFKHRYFDGFVKRGKSFMRMIAFLLLFIICGASAFSQEQPRDELNPRIMHEGTTCFLNSNSLQSLDMLFAPNDLIIIVSHLGKSEKKIMADRRLHNAETFLVRMSIKSRSPERIITSKGKESIEQGYLDFFVKGRLEYRVYLPKNKDFFVQPCVQDPEQKPCSEENARLYYPCKPN